MADFLDEKRKEIRARLQELKPLVDEYHRLEAAAQALEGVGPTTRAGAGRRGRPRGSGTRGKQALELVRANPGISIPELAEKMGIKQNYLYRVLPGLQKDGMVRKEGRGWHARDAA
jgi:hypothetical protein